MNEIERAIEKVKTGYESLLESFVIPECDGWIKDVLISALHEKQEREKGCEYCTDGKVNTLGAEMFMGLECEHQIGVYYERPYIFKTNGMYFLIVANFSPIRIYACPNCGRKLRED